MTSEKEPWFVVERSEALAGLLLTSREDVRVRNENKRNDGVDFLVEVDPSETLSTRLFVVQVKGTTSSKQEDWIEGVKELFHLGPSKFYLPACVFVVNVRDNGALYAWVAEPLIEENGVRLKFLPPGAFRDLDQSAVDEIVERVRAWYEVMARQLTTT